jgi:hypothetical protein
MAMYIRGMSNAHSAIDDLLRQPILDDLLVLDLSFAPLLHEQLLPQLPGATVHVPVLAHPARAQDIL